MGRWETMRQGYLADSVGFSFRKKERLFNARLWISCYQEGWTFLGYGLPRSLHHPLLSTRRRPCTGRKGDLKEIAHKARTAIRAAYLYSGQRKQVEATIRHQRELTHSQLRECGNEIV